MDFSRSKTALITRMDKVEKKVEEDIGRAAAQRSLIEAAEALWQKREEGRKKVSSRVFEEEKGRSQNEDNRKESEQSREDGEIGCKRKSAAAKVGEDKRGQQEHQRQVEEKNGVHRDDSRDAAMVDILEEKERRKAAEYLRAIQARDLMIELTLAIAESKRMEEERKEEDIERKRAEELREMA
jgi:hypothetical protein